MLTSIRTCCSTRLLVGVIATLLVLHLAKEINWGITRVMHTVRHRHMQVSGESLAFMRSRERVYKARRQRIRKVCQEIQSSPGYRADLDPTRLIRNRTIIYVPHRKLAYCQIPKAASSTWTRNFMILAGLKPVAKAHVVASTLLPIPRDVSVTDTFANATSIVIVRHPLSRLVSTYHSKIIRMGMTKWKATATFIIKAFRRRTETVKNSSLPEDNPLYPRPREFVAFVLSQRVNDPHWVPQYQICPFCSVNFTVYSKMEQLADDNRYFYLKSKTIPLPKAVVVDLNKSEGDRIEREKRFWERVDVGTIRRIIRFYDLDFRMFGYSEEDYFSTLHLMPYISPR